VVVVHHGLDELDGISSCIEGLSNGEKNEEKRIKKGASAINSNSDV